MGERRDDVRAAAGRMWRLVEEAGSAAVAALLVELAWRTGGPRPVHREGHGTDDVGARMAAEVLAMSPSWRKARHREEAATVVAEFRRLARAAPCMADWMEEALRDFARDGEPMHAGGRLLAALQTKDGTIAASGAIMAARGGGTSSRRPRTPSAIPTMAGMREAPARWPAAGR